MNYSHSLSPDVMLGCGWTFSGFGPDLLSTVSCCLHQPCLEFPMDQGWTPMKQKAIQGFSACFPYLLLVSTCHLFLSEILDWALHEQIFGSVPHHFLLLLLLFDHPPHHLHLPSWSFSSNNIPVTDLVSLAPPQAPGSLHLRG